MITLAMIAGFLALPPVQYDHAPTVPYTVSAMSKEAMRTACGIADPTLLGCAYPNTGAVFIRDDMTQDAFNLVLRHELGHINGWRH